MAFEYSWVWAVLPWLTAGLLVLVWVWALSLIHI